jgi:predicted Zn finger-like uncharacterized protein
MILTCPQCATRYQTDAALFGAEGRKVRCAKCGTVWRQEPPSPPIESDLEPAPFEEVVESVHEPAAPPPQRVAYTPPAYSPAAEDLPSVKTPSPQLPPARIDWAGRIGVAAGWAGLAALILIIGWSAMRFRQQIATLWPQSASFYAALGEPVNTTGLRIDDQQSHNETQDGQPVLAITGRLTNITTHEILVPQLHVTLTDDDRRVLYNWSFSANVASLKPGQTVSFLTRLQSPPLGARHAEVRLAETGK